MYIKKMRRISINILLCYIIVLMMILCSGTVVFNIKYNSEFIPFFSFFALFVLVLRNEKIKMNNEVIILMLIIFFNFIFHAVDNVAVNGLVQIMLYVIGSYATTRLITFEEYKEIYVNVAIVLAIIASIIFTGINIGIFGYSLQEINGQSYVITMLHVIGWEGYIFNTRMCGLFHEPGMFQVILNTALLYLVDDSIAYGKRKGDIGKYVILIASVIMTRSTSGYIMMCVLLGMLYIQYWKILKKIIYKVLYFSIAPMVILVGCIILKSEVIINKFSNNNISYNIRINDFYSGVKMILQKPILGYGYNSKLYKDISYSYGMDGISNGLVGFIIMFGIPAGMLLGYLLIRSCKKKIWHVPTYMIIIFYLFEQMSEACLFFPVSLAFVLGFKRENSRLQGD